MAATPTPPPTRGPEAVEALSAWLVDAIGEGLDALARDWGRRAEPAARRLVDAKLGGLADRLRDAPARWRGVTGVERRALVAEALGDLRLIAKAWERRDRLPAPLAASLRRVCVAAERRSALLADAATERVGGLWRLAGRRIVRRWDGLERRETWLRREADARAAVVYAYAPSRRGDGAAPAASSAPAPGERAGDAFDGVLAFYPAPTPLRAAYVEGVWRPFDPPPETASGAASIETALSLWRWAMAACPWALEHPIEASGLVFDAASEALIDAEGARWPLAGPPERRGGRAAKDEAARTALAALAMEGPVSAFGLWDGRSLAPLAAWSAGGFWTRAA